MGQTIRLLQDEVQLSPKSNGEPSVNTGAKEHFKRLVWLQSQGGVKPGGCKSSYKVCVCVAQGVVIKVTDCIARAGNPGQSDIAAAIGSKEGTDKILDARGHLKDPKVSFVFGKVMSDSENWQP